MKACSETASVGVLMRWYAENWKCINICAADPMFRALGTNNIWTQIRKRMVTTRAFKPDYATRDSIISDLGGIKYVLAAIASGSFRLMEISEHAPRLLKAIVGKYVCCADTMLARGLYDELATAIAEGKVITGSAALMHVAMIAKATRFMYWAQRNGFADYPVVVLPCAYTEQYEVVQ